MSDLAEFLLARIGEDEHEARFWTCDCAIEGLPLRHGLRCEERVKAECEAKRRIVEAETQNAALAEWTPDCGGDWCLSGGATRDQLGVGCFATYWPDDTVSVSVYRDGEDVATSGIVARRSRAECQAFAEQWVRDNLAEASIVLRLLALPYADHPDYRQDWMP